MQWKWFKEQCAIALFQHTLKIIIFGLGSALAVVAWPLLIDTQVPLIAIPISIALFAIVFVLVERLRKKPPNTSTQNIAESPEEHTLEMSRIGPERLREARRLEKVRRLLSEAATGIVDAQPSIDIDDLQAELRFGFRLDSVKQFLEMAFVVNHADDMRHYIQSRRDGPNQDAEIMASFLKNLEKRITSDDLDHNFLLPSTFDEFVNHENWPRNPGLKMP